MRGLSKRRYRNAALSRSRAMRKSPPAVELPSTNFALFDDRRSFTSLGLPTVSHRPAPYAKQSTNRAPSTTAPVRLAWRKSQRSNVAFVRVAFRRLAPCRSTSSHFAPLKVNDTLTLDFDNDSGFDSHHYAFKVDESAFDGIFERVKAEGIAYGSGPRSLEDMRINHRRGGRDARCCARGAVRSSARPGATAGSANPPPAAARTR